MASNNTRRQLLGQLQPFQLRAEIRPRSAAAAADEAEAHGPRRPGDIRQARAAKADTARAGAAFSTNPKNSP